MTAAELASAFRERYGKGSYHASALYRNLFKKGFEGFSDLPEFVQSRGLAHQISLDLVFPKVVLSNLVTEDGVIKFITSFEDGAEIESVVVPMKHYHTLCVSTQVGCRQGCLFCKTGRMGFKRNLTAGEIVAQLFLARFYLKKDIRNIVFMGMGEPLDNLDALTRAIQVLSDQQGFDIAHRHMTVSTVGLVEAMKKLGEEKYANLHLAISLNAPNESIRSFLMPVNTRYSMEEIRSALLSFPLRRNGFFFIAYVLIKGVNDAPEHVGMLAEYLKGVPVRLNVIPYNDTGENRFASPSDAEVQAFSTRLEQKNLFVRKRWRKGENLHAACGQLGAWG